MKVILLVGISVGIFLVESATSIAISLSDKMIFKDPSEGDLIGKRIYFVNVYDNVVITLKSDGNVIGEEFNPDNLTMQTWIPKIHPTEPVEEMYIEISNPVIEYNTLSGYENPPAQPDLFPRRWNIRYEPNSKKWEISVRRRWCLQTNGIGYEFTIDDCEFYYAPYQLWDVKIL